MNYILQLQEESKQQRQTIIGMLERLVEFRTYLNSAKFHKDTTIQVQDVHNWLDYIRDVE